jgi:hypothetical protein
MYSCHLLSFNQSGFALDIFLHPLSTHLGDISYVLSTMLYPTAFNMGCASQDTSHAPRGMGDGRAGTGWCYFSRAKDFCGVPMTSAFEPFTYTEQVRASPPSLGSTSYVHGHDEQVQTALFFHYKLFDWSVELIRSSTSHLRL